MKIPTTVKIGSQIWEISVQKRKHSAEPDNYGWTTSKDNTIVLDADLPESSMRITLFHELLHAIRFTFGGSFKPAKSTEFHEWEHYWIGIYEEPVVMMLRDNPDLVVYLLGPNK